MEERRRLVVGTHTDPRAALLDEASRPYLKAGPGLFAYLFARGKLGTDPVYRILLQSALLSGRSRVLDLGCGQSLLTAWLLAATRQHERGLWPDDWPEPPRASVRGIELMRADVARARRALGSDVCVELGDIRHAEFGSPDAVVILDVLHYLPREAQRDILRRARLALPPDGLLLLRIGDAGSGLRHRYSRWVDQVVMLLRGHAWKRLYCRSVPEWQGLLHECGFRSDAVPMSEGTPFANVLLIAHGV